MMLASRDNGSLALAERTPPLRERRAEDNGEFERVMRLYKDRVFRYVLRLTGDREEAEDITQETFVRAYRAREKFRGECSYPTWLFQIAVNLCIDRARHLRANEIVSLDSSLDGEEGGGWEPPDGSQDPLRELERAELRERVQQSLGTLPERLRKVITLYFMQDMSYEEIASILDCSVGTVKSRMFTAKARLARKLRSYVEGSV
ncbi:MAG: sigma-70 family RNA polymerase sigma factor [Abditibacteriales bacterium]|nr:sigma-70 family RNA polymerase sigma factor [Abditibacteriales bacterium]MDW8365894.1 sigma-70 family RNA polymerase sigma factor [Abditibacteriales bacterium]